MGSTSTTDFSEFRLLGHSGDPEALTVDVTSPAGDWFEWLAGEVPSEPVTVEYAHGRAQPGEMVLGGSPAVILLSKRIIDVLRKSGLTGWTTYEIRPTGALEELLTDYSGLAVTGRCVIDLSRSRRQMQSPPVSTGQQYTAWMGVYFDPASWDGSDIFLAPGTGYIFLNQRAAQALRDMRDVSLDRLEDTENAVALLNSGELE